MCRQIRIAFFLVLQAFALSGVGETALPVSLTADFNAAIKADKSGYASPIVTEWMAVDVGKTHSVTGELESIPRLSYSSSFVGWQNNTSASKWKTLPAIYANVSDAGAKVYAAESLTAADELWLHPGGGDYAMLKFTARKAGATAIRFKVTDRNATGGDGICCSVLLNGRVGTVAELQDGGWAEFTQRFAPLAVGDVVGVVVRSRKSDGAETQCDSTSLGMILCLSDESGERTYTANGSKATVAYTAGSDFDGFEGSVAVGGQTTLVIPAGAALLSDPPAPGEAVFALTNGATLCVEQDWTSGATRSWNFGSAGRPVIEVAASKTLRIVGAVSGSCGLSKRGAGTLVLTPPGGSECELTGEVEIPDDWAIPEVPGDEPITMTLQELLDKGGEVTFPDGDYEISKPLVIRSGTTLHCSENVHLRLADGANSPILINEHYASGTDGDIAVIGGLWDGNNTKQVRANYTITKPFDYGQLIMLSGVTNLTLRGMTIKDPNGFAVQLTDVERFLVEDIVFDCNCQTLNQDGIHVNGFARHGVIRRLSGQTNDDMVALNSDEGGFRSADNDISDIVIDDLDGGTAGYRAVRLLSRYATVSNVTIRNVRGMFDYGIVAFTHWARSDYVPGMGHFHDIVLSNLTATCALKSGSKDKGLVWFQDGVSDVGKVSIFDSHRSEGAGYNNTVAAIYVDKNVQINHLLLDDVDQSVSGGQEFLHVESSAHITNLEIVDDPHPEEPSDTEEDDDGLTRLYLQATDGYGQSSLSGRSGAWKSEDKSVTHSSPQSGYAYVVRNNFNLREKNQVTDYTFTGDVLELFDGNICLKNLDGGTMTIPKLRCTQKGVIQYSSDNSGVVNVAGGDWKIVSGAELSLLLAKDKSSRLNCQANISGSGTLIVGCIDGNGENAVYDTDYVKLSGDNSAFKGDVVSTIPVPLVFASSTAWPGDLDSFKANAVDLGASASTVDFMMSMTLDTPNRGIDLGSATGKFRLFAGDADGTLVIGAPISGSAGLCLARAPGSSSTAIFELPIANAALTGTLTVSEGTRVRIADKEAIANCTLDCQAGAVVEVDVGRVGSEGALVEALPETSNWTLAVTGASGKKATALRLRQKSLQEVVGFVPVVYLNGEIAAAKFVQDGEDLVLRVAANGKTPKVAKLRVNGYTGVETLKDFPVLVRISPNSIPNFDYAVCTPQQLRFSSDFAGRVVLPHEIDVWDPAGESTVWVCLPALADGVSFYLAWGAHEQVEAAADLWSGYRAVWHLDDFDASNGTTDSTGHDIKFGMNADAVTDGDFARIGRSLRVTGKLLTEAGGHGITSETDCTITGWMSCNSAQGATYGKLVDGTAFAHFETDDKAPIWLKCRTSGTQYDGNVNSASVQTFDGNAAITSGWRHFALVRSGTVGSFYVDGVKVGEYDGGAAPDSSVTQMYMGCGGTVKSIVNIDEYRIALTARSADWIAAEYDTVSNAKFIGCVGTYQHAKHGLVIFFR